MLESEIPFRAAVVAATERKLCPEYPNGSLPVAIIASFSDRTNADHVSGFREVKWNSRPGELPRNTIQDNIAAIGQNLQWVLAM